MKSQPWIMALLVVACVVLPSSVMAAPGGGGPGTNPGAFFDKKLEKALDEIDITAEQRQQLAAIRERLKTRIEREQQPIDREQRRNQMERFWASDSPDVQQLRTLIDERIERQRSRAYAVADATVEIHRVLTPEQRTELAALIDEGSGKKKENKDQRKQKQRQDQ